MAIATLHPHPLVEEAPDAVGVGGRARGRLHRDRDRQPARQRVGTLDGLVAALRAVEAAARARAEWVKGGLPMKWPKNGQPGHAAATLVTNGWR
jgi:hypothetical protein